MSLDGTRNNNNSNRFQIHGETWTVIERERKKIRWAKHKGFCVLYSLLYVFQLFSFGGFFFGCFLNAKETSKNDGKRSNNFQKKEQQK